MIKKITLILFLIISIFLLNMKIDAKTSKNLVNIYFFHSNMCSHCQEELKFLNTLEDRYTNIKIYKYEIHEEENYKILKEVEEIYDLNIESVPLTIIGTKPILGFNDKSKLTFIKTIEYFSRYGYKDEIGEFLNLKLPKYNVNKNDISLESFISNYQNYDLLGLKTDKLTPSSIALLLGVLSSINFIAIIGIVLVLLITINIKQETTRMLGLILYVSSTYILLLSNIMYNSIFNIIIICILSIIILNRMKQKNKQQHIYYYYTFIIVISFVINVVLMNISNKYTIIFKNILKLYNLTGLSKMYYYNNFMITNTITNIIIMYISYITISKVKNYINHHNN